MRDWRSEITLKRLSFLFILLCMAAFFWSPLAQLLASVLLYFVPDGYTPDTIPNVILNRNQCNSHTLNPHVCDTSGVLSSSESLRLNNRLEEFKNVLISVNGCPAKFYPFDMYVTIVPRVDESFCVRNALGICLRRNTGELFSTAVMETMFPLGKKDVLGCHARFHLFYSYLDGYLSLSSTSAVVDEVDANKLDSLILQMFPSPGSYPLFRMEHSITRVAQIVSTNYDAEKSHRLTALRLSSMESYSMFFFLSALLFLFACMIRSPESFILGCCCSICYPFLYAGLKLEDVINSTLSIFQGLLFKPFLFPYEAHLEWKYGREKASAARIAWIGVVLALAGLSPNEVKAVLNKGMRGNNGEQRFELANKELIRCLANSEYEEEVSKAIPKWKSALLSILGWKNALKIPKILNIYDTEHADEIYKVKDNNKDNELNCVDEARKADAYQRNNKSGSPNSEKSTCWVGHSALYNLEMYSSYFKSITDGTGYLRKPQNPVRNNILTDGIFGGVFGGPSTSSESPLPLASRKLNFSDAVKNSNSLPLVKLDMQVNSEDNSMSFPDELLDEMLFGDRLDNKKLLSSDSQNMSDISLQQEQMEGHQGYCIICLSHLREPPYNRFSVFNNFFQLECTSNSSNSSSHSGNHLWRYLENKRIKRNGYKIIAVENNTINHEEPLIVQSDSTHGRQSKRANSQELNIDANNLLSTSNSDPYAVSGPSSSSCVASLEVGEAPAEEGHLSCVRMSNEGCMHLAHESCHAHWMHANFAPSQVSATVQRIGEDLISDFGCRPCPWCSMVDSGGTLRVSVPYWSAEASESSLWKLALCGNEALRKHFHKLACRFRGYDSQPWNYSRSTPHTTVFSDGLFTVDPMIPPQLALTSQDAINRAQAAISDTYVDGTDSETASFTEPLMVIYLGALSAARTLRDKTFAGLPLAVKPANPDAVPDEGSLASILYSSALVARAVVMDSRKSAERNMNTNSDHINNINNNHSPDNLLLYNSGIHSVDETHAGWTSDQQRSRLLLEALLPRLPLRTSVAKYPRTFLSGGFGLSLMQPTRLAGWVREFSALGVCRRFTELVNVCISRFWSIAGPNFPPRRDMAPGDIPILEQVRLGLREMKSKHTHRRVRNPFELVGGRNAKDDADVSDTAQSGSNFHSSEITTEPKLKCLDPQNPKIRPFYSLKYGEILMGAHLGYLPFMHAMPVVSFQLDMLLNKPFIIPFNDSGLDYLINPLCGLKHLEMKSKMTRLDLGITNMQETIIKMRNMIRLAGIRQVTILPKDFGTTYLADNNSRFGKVHVIIIERPFYLTMTYLQKSKLNPNFPSNDNLVTQVEKFRKHIYESMPNNLKHRLQEFCWNNFGLQAAAVDLIIHNHRSRNYKTCVGDALLMGDLRLASACNYLPAHLREMGELYGETFSPQEDIPPGGDEELDNFLAKCLDRELVGKFSSEFGVSALDVIHDAAARAISFYFARVLMTSHCINRYAKQGESPICVMYMEHPATSAETLSLDQLPIDIQLASIRNQERLCRRLSTLIPPVRSEMFDLRAGRHLNFDDKELLDKIKDANSELWQMAARLRLMDRRLPAITNEDIQDCVLELMLESEQIQAANSEYAGGEIPDLMNLLQVQF